MSMLTFLSKPDNSPPSAPKTAAEIQAGIAQLEAKSAGYAEAVALAALNAADQADPATAEGLNAAIDAQNRHQSALNALKLAHNAAIKRDQGAMAALRLQNLTEQSQRVARLLQRREKAGAELAAAIEAAVRAFKTLTDLSERAAIAHVRGTPLETMRDFALGPKQVVRLVENELYRVGNVPFRGGDPLHKYDLSFPGGKAPVLKTPAHLTKPLVDAVRDGNDAAQAAQEAKLDELRAAAGVA